MKKLISFLVAAFVITATLTACGSNNGSYGGGSPTPSGGASQSALKGEIHVISREDGSGTRGAFIELFGIEVKDADGKKKDYTTKETSVVNKTDVMLSTVSGDKDAIGYCSIGSLNDSVKSVAIDGVIGNEENVTNGTYKITRPFIVVTNGEATGLAKDFLDFIMSAEGQDVVAKKCSKVDENAPAYNGNKPSGKITVAGSSSVTPVMEDLKQAYIAINPNADIQIQMTDSTGGIQSAIDGTCEIGMSSRQLKDAEKEKLTPTQIAIDGVAVIVSANNPLTDLTKEQVRQIFTGEVTDWSETGK